jgi:hypothetical protein
LTAPAPETRRGSALALANNGARAIVADVLDEQGPETVDLMEAAGGDVMC